MQGPWHVILSWGCMPFKEIEYQRAFSLSTSFLLSFFVYFFLRLCLWLKDIKILSYRALDGSHKNRSPKANMQISLIKFITGLHILYHFMVKIRTFFQLHEYKYNIKFCRWSVFKGVGELSSILSVNCLQKPCQWTVSIPVNRPIPSQSPANTPVICNHCPSPPTYGE